MGARSLGRVGHDDVGAVLDPHATGRLSPRPTPFDEIRNDRQRGEDVPSKSHGLLPFLFLFFGYVAIDVPFSCKSAEGIVGDEIDEWW